VSSLGALAAGGAADRGPTGDLFADLEQVMSYHFMVNAVRAGTVAAVLAGALGYVMVLRRQSFAGHTLAVAGFPGAAGATLLGLDPDLGYFGFCVGAALLLAATPAGERDPGGGAGDRAAATAVVQSLALSSGFLFVSLYGGFLSGLDNLLFGSITGITDHQVGVLAMAGAAVLAVLAAVGRPLLFATLAPTVAAARGVPVRLLDTGFLVLLGVAAAGTSRVTGSLLVFALLVAPAAAAVRLTADPAVGLCLSVGIAVLVTWVGEVAAFFSPWPIGFWVTTLAFAVFLGAAGVRAVADRAGAIR